MSTPTPTPGAEDLPVAVIGAGPVGLAAAAHLVERGLEPLILEQGHDAAAAVSAWGHVRLFSPWQYDIDAAARRILAPTGWVAPDGDTLPTGAELVTDYLAPLAATPQIAPHLRTGSRVVAIWRDGADRARTLGRERRPFRLRIRATDGAEHDVLARAVIDATGTWGHSNPLGSGGVPALGEETAQAFVTGPLPDVLGAERERFAGRRTLVVGRGHSAANTLLALVELAETEPDTEITWAIRGGSARRLYGGAGADELPARGHLGERLRAAVESGAVTLATHVAIDQFAPGRDGVVVSGRRRDEPIQIEVDAVVDATGFRPNLAMLREIRLDLDPVIEAPRELAPLIDPNEHSCGTVRPHGEALLRHPEQGFYVVGSKSYGRAPTFLLATGYEQVRSVVAALAGDRTAADAVELNLPSTGVCSTDLTPEEIREEAGLADVTTSCASPVLAGAGAAPDVAPARGGCC